MDADFVRNVVPEISRQRSRASACASALRCRVRSSAGGHLMDTTTNSVESQQQAGGGRQPFPGNRTRLLEFLTSFQIGGTERHVVNLTNALDPQQFDMHVGCLDEVGP